MRDLESTNLEAAAHLAREADPGWDDRPSPSEYEDGPDMHVGFNSAPGFIHREAWVRSGIYVEHGPIVSITVEQPDSGHLMGIALKPNEARDMARTLLEAADRLEAQDG